MKLHKTKKWGACSFVLFTLIGSVIVQADSQKGVREMTIASGK